MANLIRSLAMAVASFLLVPAAIPQAKASPETSFPSCNGNADCMAMLSNENLLLMDEGRVAVKGKKKEARTHIITTAAIYVSEHMKEQDQSNYYRFFNCVSRALAGEITISKTLFSSENVIQTYYAFSTTQLGQDGIRFGVGNICDLLGQYYSQIRHTRHSQIEEQKIEQKAHKLQEPDPETIWHNLQADYFRRRYPAENPDENVRGSEKQYCVFSAECHDSQNDPFTKK